MRVVKSKLDQYPNLKVILMSATLNTELFEAYFEESHTIQIAGRTHEVELFYLGGILKLIKGQQTTQSEQQLEEQYAGRFQFNKEHFEDLAVVSDLIVALHHAKPLAETILVFLPGASEFEILSKSIEDKILTIDYKLFTLHSQGENDEKVFVKSPGCRKIILATNIAETSITIEDAVSFTIN